MHVHAVTRVHAVTPNNRTNERINMNIQNYTCIKMLLHFTSMILNHIFHYYFIESGIINISSVFSINLYNSVKRIPDFPEF